MDDDKVDNIVDDIVTQLQGTVRLAAEAKKEEDDVTRENLEDFIIKSASKLVSQSLSFVDNAQYNVSTGAQPEDIEAAAALVKAATSAIDSLSKLSIANSKNKSQRDIKELDIKSKEQRNLADNQTKILISHKDVISALIGDDEDEDDEYEGDTIDIK